MSPGRSSRRPAVRNIHHNRRDGPPRLVVFSLQRATPPFWLSAWHVGPWGKTFRHQRTWPRLQDAQQRVIHHRYGWHTDFQDAQRRVINRRSGWRPESLLFVLSLPRTEIRPMY